jgi:hypothetical protein
MANSIEAAMEIAQNRFSKVMIDPSKLPFNGRPAAVNQQATQRVLRRLFARALSP